MRRRNDDEQAIALAGELDLGSAERVSQELQRTEAARVRRIALDLSHLEFIDSNGIRLILEADARADRRWQARADLRPTTGASRLRAAGTSDRLPFVAGPSRLGR